MNEKTIQYLNIALSSLDENQNKSREEIKELIQYYKNIKNEKLILPFTENDVEELRNGESFKWCFETDQGRAIDVHIELGDNENYL